MWEPFGTASTNTTAYWKSSPNERGTFSILSSCVITLVLCAYTSLHLNIPEHGKATWRHQFWLRAFWVLVGLIAPEIIAFIAFKQWLCARNFEHQMRNHFGSLDPGSGPATDVENGVPLERIGCGCAACTESRVHTTPRVRSRRRFSWTRVHSHFALMGGFAFDTASMPVNILPDSRTRLTLTPLALDNLARKEPDMIPDISEEAIQDKSKSNGFAKLLVCLQASWFIAQTIGRLATSSLVSLLEMNTLLHALCCLVIYLAWWHKPHDIEEPLLLETSTELAAKICAWMVMDSKLGVRREAHDGPREELEELYSLFLMHNDQLEAQWHDRTLSCYKVKRMLYAARRNNELRGRAETIYPGDDGTQASLARNNEEELMKLYPGQKVHGFRLVYLPKSDDEAACCNVYMSLTQGDLECLRLATTLRNELKNDWEMPMAGYQMLSDWKGMLTTKMSVASSPKGVDRHKQPEFNHKEHVFNKRAKYLSWAGLMGAGSIYGVVHLIAWNGPFTTQIQTWMWRTSCFVIASPIVLLPVMFVTIAMGGWIYWYFNLRRRWLVRQLVIRPVEFCRTRYNTGLKQLPKYWQWKVPRVTSEVFYTALPGTFALVYVAARVYLLVECFIQLGYLPAAVYQEPEWSKFIPHFGSG